MRTARGTGCLPAARALRLRGWMCAGFTKRGPPTGGARLVNADAANAAASSMIKLSTPTELPYH